MKEHVFMEQWSKQPREGAVCQFPYAESSWWTISQQNVSWQSSFIDIIAGVYVNIPNVALTVSLKERFILDARSKTDQTKVLLCYLKNKQKKTNPDWSIFTFSSFIFESCNIIPLW